MLCGRYTVSRFRSDKSDNAKYLMAPKTRSCGLSPITVEIKLNRHDMNHVFLLDSGASLPLPPTQWNFVTVTNLLAGEGVGNNKVDLCGAILYTGR